MKQKNAELAVMQRARAVAEAKSISATTTREQLMSNQVTGEVVQRQKAQESRKAEGDTEYEDSDEEMVQENDKNVRENNLSIPNVLEKIVTKPNAYVT